MRPITVIVFACLLFAACGKKKNEPGETPDEPPVTTPVASECKDIPAPPSTFGWADSTGDPNKNVNAFFYNPVNPDEIIYVVNGDGFGFNKMFTHNLVTKVAVQIGILGPYPPQVNKNGWIVYSDVNNNVILVKSDGTGQKTLAGSNHARDPKWDYSGNYIYYYLEAHDQIGSQLVKIDTTGANRDAFPIELAYTAPFRKSEKLLYIKVKGISCTLILKELGVPGSETDLLNAPLNSAPGQVYFDNLILDNNDENFYWSNSHGIFRCNLTSLKIDTVLKNCQNTIYDNPLMSFKTGEMTFSKHFIKPVSSFTLLHQFTAIELNLLNMQQTEVRIFN